MRYLVLRGAISLLALIASAGTASAGRPSSTLTNAATLRLQSLSFFAVVYLVVAGVIYGIWFQLRKEFPRLPRSGYVRALGLVGLCGVFVLLGSLVSPRVRTLLGSRDESELNHLDTEASLSAPTQQQRRERLESLYRELTTYANQHDGSFPPSIDASAIPAERWETLHVSRIHYVYRPGHTVRDGGRVLVCEPELFDDGRYVLFTAGEMRLMASPELTALLEREGK